MSFFLKNVFARCSLERRRPLLERRPDHLENDLSIPGDRSGFFIFVFRHALHTNDQVVLITGAAISILEAPNSKPAT
jgi:hypothetical protein